MSRAEGIIVQKRMSFLSSLVWGVSSVLIVVLLCAAGIIFYAMTIFDSRVSGVVELFDGALEVCRISPAPYLSWPMPSAMNDVRSISTTST